jgi:hypothetical protein
MARNLSRKGLIGINKVVKNLNKELSRIEVKGAAGLIKATILIRREMDTVPPKIPVDTSNLRSSWFVTSAQGIKQKPKFDDTGAANSAASRAKTYRKPVVIMGFAASYAVLVHERIGADINWNRPGSGGKFFEAALVRNKEEIIQIIQNETKIK